MPLAAPCARDAAEYLLDSALCAQRKHLLRQGEVPLRRRRAVVPVRPDASFEEELQVILAVTNVSCCTAALARPAAALPPLGTTLIYPFLSLGPTCKFQGLPERRTSDLSTQLGII